jgi:hypothetical protein
MKDNPMGKSLEPSRIFLGLVHYPVRNKNGDVITSSIYAPDVHDLSRLARTYALGGLFLVHPTPSQVQLVQRILKHWREGFGSRYNTTRTEALTTTELVGGIEGAMNRVMEITGQTPLVFTTTAQRLEGQTTLATLRQHNQAGSPLLILFGTGWGLTEEALHGYNGVLEPIDGFQGFNHLSVRSAVSIMVDRLLCEGES